MAANGSSLWTIRQRTRDPFTKKQMRFSLTDQEFQISARLQLGAGLYGLVETPPPQTKCACRNRSSLGPFDPGLFHILHSCHLHQGNRNRRHAAVQRAYEDLVRRAGLTVNRLAPEVTPLQRSSQNNAQRCGKKEFGDWKAHDDEVDAEIVFDNTCCGPFTVSALKAGNKGHHNGLPCRGWPGLYSTATERRKIKMDAKAQGCHDREQIFLPLINTSSGAFVPHDPTTLKCYTDEVKRVFGDGFRQVLGRVGTRPRSVEEGLIRRWARRSADVEAGGKGVFDTTLTVKGAAGLMVSHTHRVISHSALKFTADAVLFAVRSNGLTFHT